VILDAVTSVPLTTEVPHAAPHERARVIQTAAALKAAGARKGDEVEVDGEVLEVQ